MRRQPATKFRITLLMDNPYRDLPGLVLVAWRLCQNGAICYLVPMNLRNNEVWPLAPDFVLLNHFRTIYEGFVKNLMEAGILVGVLDTEGSVFSPLPADANITLNNPEQKEIMRVMEGYSPSMVRDTNLRHNISTYCAWTPAFAEYATQEDWYCPEQITVTGIPRVDFYADRWRAAARRISQYANGYDEPMILINGGFTLANPRYQSPEKELEMMITKFSYSRSFVNKGISTQKNALEVLSSLANTLAGHFPKVTFIYCPHPFEGEEIYRSLLKPLPNLHLVKQGTVDGWLLRAKALIHWGGRSTAIEACLAGIPAFTAGWIPVHLPVPAVEEVSIKCSTEEELMLRISDVLEGNFSLSSKIAEKIDKVVENTFYKIDGKSHRRVADAILKAVYSNNPQPSVKKCHDFIYGRAKSPTALLSISLKKIFRLSPHWSFKHWKNIIADLAWDHSGKQFDVNQVRDIVNAIRECAQTDSRDQVRKVHVHSAQKHGDYLFGYMQGRSVILIPE